MSELARVALAGNPNTGKSTLFNRLTGAQVRVGNYPGVTVELTTAELALASSRALLVDLPGSYSLTARSREEQVAVQALLGLDGSPRPQLAVCCVDATNLSRNLYFVLQAQELGLRVVVALTMVDEAGADAPDSEALARVLDCPVVPVVARTGQGIAELKRCIERVLADSGPVEPRLRFEPSERLQRCIEQVKTSLPEAWPRSDGLALWALMSIGDGDELEVPATVRATVERALPDADAACALDDECVQGRYRFIDEHVRWMARPTRARAMSERVDRVLVHPVFGFGVFLLVNALIFQALFAWSEPVMDVIESAFSVLSEVVQPVFGDNVWSELVADGLIAGVGSVVVFLPQILLLFFCIGLMEDSGYMARVAYLMDRIMKSMGLHGRAFVPMLSGFACAVPAIMATRTMERQRDRLLTMMVVPLMTCSARLPVYTLIIGALFSPAARFFGVSVPSLLMIGMYLFSVGIALAAAWVLSKTLLPATGSALILELPPYRLPRLGDVSRMMWRRASAFLREAGTVILACSVALWFLLNFPREPRPLPTQDASTARAVSKSERLNHSYGARLGHLIEPVIAPLGFDWKIGVGIIGAFAAREVFVATMGVVYAASDDADEENESLRDKLRSERRPDGRVAYTPLVGLSLMVFFALACQCVSTLAVVRRETHSWRWPIFLFAYMTSLAWLASCAIYQGGKLLGFG